MNKAEKTISNVKKAQEIYRNGDISINDYRAFIKKQNPIDDNLVCIFEKKKLKQSFDFSD